MKEIKEGLRLGGWRSTSYTSLLFWKCEEYYEILGIRL